jgi:WD40 repeat protein
MRRKLADGTSSIRDLCVAPDGKTLAVAREADHVHDKGVVELWDVASGELKTSLGKEHGAALCVTFSPDGRTLASGHRNGKIVRWQAATDEQVRRQTPN